MSHTDTIQNWGIYAITDRAMAGGRTHAEIGAELIEGGVRVIQVRDKTTAYEELLEDTKRLVALARDRGVSVIANDNPYLARDADADGVHLGQTDCPLSIARDVLGPDKIIGLSTHSRGQALRAQEKGEADYIGIGPIYATATKEQEYAPLGLRTIRWATKTLTVPFTVIGGITAERLADVVAAGARQCAMVSALMATGDIAAATRECIRVYEAISSEDDGE